MENELIQILIARGLHISVAESCTGGMVMARLVSVADASRVLDAGIVTYSNEAKQRYLGVPQEVLEQYGAVSEQTAAYMAAGVAHANGAEIGISVTGLAGPGGATAEKPVGMVCFGLYLNGEVKTCTEQFGNIGRNQVREASADYILEWLRRELAPL